MKTCAVTVLLFLLLAVPLSARVDLLLVPPARPVPATAGTEFTIHVNNPTDAAETAMIPASVEADYATEVAHGRTVLDVVGGRRSLVIPPMRRAVVHVRLTQPLNAAGGFASLRLTTPPTNAILFELAGPPPPPAEPRPMLHQARHIDLISDVETMRGHISGYDPIYFAIGWRERFNARFQFSFKYRVFEHGITAEPWWKDLGRDLYIAYTQTSIWDLESFSKPFYDTSYKPTAFLLHELERTPGSPWSFSLQAGAQHESNGKGSGTSTGTNRPGLVSEANALRHPAETRSLNTLYFMPQVRWSDNAGLFFAARARINAYFQIDENPDIARYRGYAELTLRGGYDRGPQLSAHLRGKLDGHGSVEFNLTWPTSETPLLNSIEFLRTLGGYTQIQYFNGYGESLLDYDVRRKDQLRFGLMIVR